MVNWAPIAPGAGEGGGVNGYSQQLAIELVARGHEVAWLSSGWTYVATSAGELGGPSVRRMADWRGIMVFDLINSPVIAPGPVQHADPLGEVSSPRLEAEFARFVGLLRPDVVHFQNIEGLSAGCVAAARSSGAASVFSLHNYHTVCPQVYLMQPVRVGDARGAAQGRVACHDFAGGKACVGCVREPEPRAESLRRGKVHPLAILASEESERATRAAREEAQRAAAAPGILSLLRRKPVQAAFAPRVVEHLPGRAVAQDADVIADTGGGTFEPLWRSLLMDESSPEWRVLENAPLPDRSGTANAYGERRAAMVAMLSSCDSVLAVSRFVAEKFAALGVRREAIVTLGIGTRMAEIALEMPELTRTRQDTGSGERTLRTVFLGYHNYYKGLHVLLDALELMPPAALSRVELRVHARAVEAIEWRLERLRGRLAGLVVTRGYEYRDVPALLSGVDVGVVPSVWWDNGPQTVLEMLAMRVPVLGAELGGIPDMVTHGVNGLLHRGNDRRQLSTQLAELAMDPARAARLREGITPVKTMRAHAVEVEGVYAGAVRARHARG